MKTIVRAVEKLTLKRLLDDAAGFDVVFLTEGGQVRFALMPADEDDQEVCALKSNAQFMAYLTDCEERAKHGPRRSLKEMQETYGTASAHRPLRKKAGKAH